MPSSWGWPVPGVVPRPSSTTQGLVTRRAEQADLGTQAMTSSWTQRRPAVFTSTEVVYGVTGTDVTELPEYGVSP
jgi:hypothetical protein